MVKSFSIREYLDKHAIPQSNIPLEVLAKVDDSVNDLIDRIVGAKLQDPLKPPQTPEEFKSAILDFIRDSGLQDFFPHDNPIPQEIANNAAKLLKDPDFPIKDPVKVLKVARVCIYDITLYCDDSLSMTQGNRIQTQVSFARRLATIIMPFRNGVINLRFINAATQPTWNKMNSVDEIAAAVQAVPYTGYTPIGTQLHNKVLKPFTDQLPTGNVFRTPDNKPVLPMMVLCITDGWPYNESNEHFRDVCVAAKKELARFGDRVSQVGIKFQVNQIGDEAQANAFLQSLKDDADLKDNLYVTAEKLDAKFQEFKDNLASLDAWIAGTVSRQVTVP